MTIKTIKQSLFEQSDPTYAKFIAKLIPTMPPSYFIGVRAPVLKRYAKTCDDALKATFMADLPHEYHDENMLQVYMINSINDYDKVINVIEAFLPYINNWATCDSLAPTIFKKRQYRGRLLGKIKQWLKSDELYTQRFAINMLMRHYLDDDFDSAYLELVSQIKTEQYYLKMVIAWYFATALAKQYVATLPYITAYRLGQWIHNKTIQKAVESNRITATHKDELRQYRWH